MRRLLTITVVALILLAIILTGCSGQTAAPATTAAPQTSAPATTAAPTTAAPKPTAAPTTTAPAAAQPIVWRAASFLPRNMFSVRGMTFISEQVKARSNGQFTIQYLGGPEVVPAMQQAEAIRRNVIQMALVPGSYYTGLVPMGFMFELSELTPAEERASGAWAFINELHSKAGLYYLDRATCTSSKGYFTLMLRQPITTPYDLKGKRIGATSNNVQPFFSALGGAAPIIPAPDVYTAVERGVVDGFSYPITNSVDTQLQTLCRALVDHPYVGAGGAVICGLEEFNKLPKEMQVLLDKIGQESVAQYIKDYAIEEQTARKKCADAGMKFIKFTAEDEAYWYKTCTEAGWADNVKQYPDIALKMRALMTRK
jgi:TRAP-type C4-dicarboxylate transport system substrate-binding protein